MKELYELPIKREPGKLYFIKTGENGNLLVCETMMKRGGRKKKSKNRRKEGEKEKS